MEHDDDQESPCFIPVIARLDRLDRLVQLLEEKRSVSRSDFGAAESKNKSWTLSSALEEVQHKGTLMERIAILEKRVLELSVEIDEGDMSRSSSSTIQDSERKDESGDRDAITKQQMEVPSTIQAQEIPSPAVGFVTENAAAHKARRQKKRFQKWPWLFRYTC